MTNESRLFQEWKIEADAMIKLIGMEVKNPDIQATMIEFLQVAKLRPPSGAEQSAAKKEQRAAKKEQRSSWWAYPSRLPLPDEVISQRWVAWFDHALAEGQLEVKCSFCGFRLRIFEKVLSAECWGCNRTLDWGEWIIVEPEEFELEGGK